MYKTTFYSMTYTQDGIKPVKREGYGDTNFYYYKDFSNDNHCNVWYAIEPMTGCSVCSATTKTECARLANSTEMIDKLNKFKQTDKYTQAVNRFYKAEVEDGIIMENPVH